MPSAGFVRAVLDGHSALGLGLGALIYLVCLSGTLAVFADEFAVWEQPSAAPIERMAPAAIDRAMAAALAEVGPSAALYAVLPSATLPRLGVTTYGAAGPRAWITDGSGETVVKRTPWTDFVTDLHMTLTLPAPWGGSLVGLAGVALLALIATGLLAHPRLFKDAFAYRPNRSRRLGRADLHNRLGVWGLPFHLAITLTGAFFGLSTLLVIGVTWTVHHGDPGWAANALTGPAVAADGAPAPLPPLAAMLAALGDDAGAPTFVYVERPGTRGQKITIETAATRRLAHGERHYFDGAGRLLGAGGFLDGSLGAQVYGAAAGLHFGTYGGLPVKLAYGLLGTALTVVAESGMAIWLARRRDGGRPAPRLERLWTAAVWAVPLALAAAAVAGLPPEPVFWSGLALVLACGTLASDPTALSRRLRLALAAALVAALARHGSPAGNTGELLVLGLLIATGLSLRRRTAAAARFAS